MAKIKPSPFIGEASGKLGSIVFSRNNAGPYIRNYVIPVNHRSIAQQAIRGRFAQAAALWSTLSNEQKQAWNDYATNPTRFNPIRKMNYGGIKGQQAFISHYVETMDIIAKAPSLQVVTSTPPGLGQTALATSYPTNPPAVPVDGTIKGAPIEIIPMGPITVSTTSNTISGMFQVNIVAPPGGATGPAEVPIMPNEILKDGHENNITFGFYISDPKKNYPNYAKKMTKKIFQTPLITNPTSNPINVQNFQLSFSFDNSVRGYYQFPNNNLVDVTCFMLSDIGHGKLLNTFTIEVIQV